MAELKPRHILILVVALVLLGALAWGVGWVAHSLVARSAPTSAATMAPPALPAATPTSTAPLPTAAHPTSTPRPTSTPAPTITPSPTPAETTYTVTPRDGGLWDVARHACALTDPGEIEVFVERIKERNGLYGPNPVIHPGDVLIIPPCP